MDSKTSQIGSITSKSKADDEVDTKLKKNCYIQMHSEVLNFQLLILRKKTTCWERLLGVSLMQDTQDIQSRRLFFIRLSPATRLISLPITYLYLKKNTRTWEEDAFSCLPGLGGLGRNEVKSTYIKQSGSQSAHLSLTSCLSR